MRRAYKFRAYPSTSHISRLVSCLEDHRILYNAALEERREAWKLKGVSIGFYQQCAQLKDIRAFDSSQERWSSQSQQAVLRRLDRAMTAFYHRCKTGKEPGYPRFKAPDRWHSVEWPLHGNGCRWKPDTGRIYLKGIGHIKVRAHRQVQGTIKTVVLKREGHRWYIVFSCDEVPMRPLSPTGRQVGVDVGVARFATTSDEEITPNPKFLRGSEKELIVAQQILSRKERGSANRRRAKAKVAEVHRRIRNRRTDFHHKTARAFINTCDVIALEKLNTVGMTKRPMPKLSFEQADTFLPNGAVAKSGLNKSILDAGWAQFMKILVDKAEEAGRQIVFVNPAYTSINCHQCGRRCTRPQRDTVICPVHGEIDADVNGARNIYSRAGLGSVWTNAVRESSGGKLLLRAVTAGEDPYQPVKNPDAPPLPDPEREQFERLKAKFGE